MSVEHKFLKQLVTSPVPDLVTGMPYIFTVKLDSTLIKPEDVDSISVALNGQIIQPFKPNSDVKLFAKYFYSVAVNNTAYTTTPGTIGVESSCDVTLTITANQAFLAPGYDPTKPDTQRASFSDSDVVYISFYYTVVRGA